MKHTRWISLIICLSFASVLFGFSPAGWFAVTEVAKGVYRIEDNKAVNIYLITGRDSSLVVDTGMGTADLVSAIRKLSPKPLIVVNTHGHPDHAGANYQFSLVYVHPGDSAASRAFNAPEARKSAAAAMQGGMTPDAAEVYRGPVYNTILKPVREGRIFNLGDRKIEVIETPGHTPGGISLLDREAKIMFTGDNNNILVWLFLQGCSPLSEYVLTLEKQQKMSSLFSTLMPGHGGPITSDFINDQVKCVKGIIEGTLESKPYKSFAGDAMISTSGRASVAFNPANIRR